MNFYRLTANLSDQDNQVDYGTTNDMLEYLDNIRTALIEGAVEQIAITFSLENNPLEPLGIVPRTVQLERVDVEEVEEWAEQNASPNDPYSVLESLINSA